ncbi:MAG: hypothetical protein FH761_11385, partial [Firmicutes bacterium]|nr:hypothetical protein [Bacillota bacterium]
SNNSTNNSSNNSSDPYERYKNKKNEEISKGLDETETVNNNSSSGQDTTNSRNNSSSSSSQRDIVNKVFKKDDITSILINRWNSIDAGFMDILDTLIDNGHAHNEVDPETVDKINIDEGDINSGNIGVPNGYNDNQKAQFYLSEMGFDIGTNKDGSPLIDGDPGVKTSYSLILFQYYNNHYNSDKPTITGEINKETLEYLKNAAENGLTYEKIMKSDYVKNWTHGNPTIEKIKSDNGTYDINSDKFVRIAGGEYVEREAAIAWSMMVNAAIEHNKTADIKLNINKFKANSGYRTYKRQIELYFDELWADGSDAWNPTFADYTAANEAKKEIRKNWWYRKILDSNEWNEYKDDLRGHGNSNHGYGLAIDFRTGDPGSEGHGKGFAKTEEVRWLLHNAPLYGFTPNFDNRYGIPATPNKTVFKETWHWNYQPTYAQEFVTKWDLRR